MNFMNRAWLYIVRKRGKSILLFVILLVMATFVLTALALGNASKAAQQELRQSLGGSFLIGFDYTENNPYLKVESVEGGTLMYSTQQISPELVEQIRGLEGIKECSATVEGLAAFLSGSGRLGRVWEDLELLENRLEGFREQAYEYRYNILRPHAGYYLRYFEMRAKQCLVLRNLHGELAKLSSLPEQAAVVASFMAYCASYVHEPNDPGAQLTRLHGVMEQMKAEPLPGTREEFENRATLYHILMDLEDFLLYKRTFVEAMDERLRSIYWEQRSAR